MAVKKGYKQSPEHIRKRIRTPAQNWMKSLSLKSALSGLRPENITQKLALSTGFLRSKCSE